MKTFTTEQVLTETQVDRNVLHRWVDTGIVVPDVAANVGKGKPRLFSVRNLLQVLVARELHRFSISSAHILRVLDYLRSLDADTTTPDLAERWLRYRTWELPVDVLLIYLADPENPTFQLMMGSGPPPLRFTVPAWLTIDLGAIYSSLMVRTEKWPAELMRKPNKRLWAKIQAADDVYRDQLEAENFARAEAIVAAHAKT